MKVLPIKKEEAYAEGLQPSMSSSSTLIECSWSYGKTFDRGESSEPARYGSAFHELLAGRYLEGAHQNATPIKRPLMQTVAKKWGVTASVDELKEHVPAAYAELTRWLSKNEYKIDFEEVRRGGRLLIEQGVALKPLDSGRAIEAHDEDHRYHGLSLGEQPGTLDLAIVPVTYARIGTTQVYRPIKGKKDLPVLVLDHKTGEEDFSKPLDKAQLLSLAAAVMRWTGASEAIVGALHARRRGLPKVYTEQVKLSELRSYETRVKNSLARIGDGSMRPGAWCSRCPARTICPAQDGQLLEKAGDVLTGLTAAGGALSKEGLTANDVALIKAPAGGLSFERKLGLLYEIAKLGEVMASRIRDEIKKAMVEAGGNLLPETRNGYLMLREYEKESLSKNGIIETYGKLAGERMLTKLRKDGAIKVSKVTQLWPERERGQ